MAEFTEDDKKALRETRDSVIRIEENIKGLPERIAALELARAAESGRSSTMSGGFHSALTLAAVLAAAAQAVAQFWKGG